MPTINIPDKICPHCGGIKWHIAYRKYKNPQYTCFILLREREKKRYLANPEPYKQRAKQATSRLWLIRDPEVLEKRYAKQAEWRKNNPDKVRAYKRKAEKKIRTSMNDEYIKRQIIQLDGFEHFSFNNIPQKLIDLKRKQLLLTRQLKQLQNEKEKQER
jgi:hypothetical protein